MISLKDGPVAGAGYRVTGLGHTVQREDLDDAVRDWVRATNGKEN